MEIINIDLEEIRKIGAFNYCRKLTEKYHNEGLTKEEIQRKISKQRIEWYKILGLNYKPSKYTPNEKIEEITEEKLKIIWVFGIGEGGIINAINAELDVLTSPEEMAIRNKPENINSLKFVLVETQSEKIKYNIKKYIHRKRKNEDYLLLENSRTLDKIEVRIYYFYDNKLEKWVVYFDNKKILLKYKENNKYTTKRIDNIIFIEEEF